MLNRLPHINGTVRWVVWSSASVCLMCVNGRNILFSEYSYRVGLLYIAVYTRISNLSPYFFYNQCIVNICACVLQRVSARVCVRDGLKPLGKLRRDHPVTAAYPT